MNKLLIVDDDAEIRTLLVKVLEKYNYETYAAKDGIEMFKCLENHDVDLIILDVMLPGEDGLTLCRRLREKSQIPIIMLTAASEDTDRIIGLEIGADDYVSKPFNPRELIARVKAVLRRASERDLSATATLDQQQATKCLDFGGWRLDMATRQLMSPDNIEITISAGEYELLTAFLERPQQVLSRDQLLDVTQNRPAGPFDRSIDVQVSRIRQKIEVDPKNPKIIKTVRGGGYLFTLAVNTIKQDES